LNVGVRQHAALTKGLRATAERKREIAERECEKAITRAEESKKIKKKSGE
jgi:hypothetical protein